MRQNVAQFWNKVEVETKISVRHKNQDDFVMIWQSLVAVRCDFVRRHKTTLCGTSMPRKVEQNVVKTYPLRKAAVQERYLNIYNKDRW